MLQQQLAIKQNQVMATAISDPMKQLLTHQHLTVRFIEVALKSKPIAFSKALWIPKANLNKYPFPKLITDYLKKKA